MQFGNRLVFGLYYMVDFPIKLLEFLAISMDVCVTQRCPDGTQSLSLLPILAAFGELLASNGSIVSSRNPNLIFVYMERTYNDLFLSSFIKCTVELYRFGHRFSWFTTL
ncbi:hypothetical protein TNCT_242211 [Trichonephila clavata]|uniref:Uncharacterized protein n=1 Tax=Trichonephila clavata TaxID=2740835 RepID=A0A8X6LMQ8_TRICU|nr:hypothetical protein TNCT_242211 [Trichonephila clavata]